MDLSLSSAPGRADVTNGVRRGTMRLLAGLGLSPLAEVPLPGGRRLDLLALARDGRLVAVEIKSCREDFLSDAKWQLYLDHADAFYFAVPADFPAGLLPAEEGLIVADRFHGEILRPARERPLAAARRRALLLRFGRLAAARLHAMTDPDARLGNLRA
ncbi:MmcB family DNA repair protein [Geminicoccaceae bacterium 1502E]|nr:MmcB family DNA repair protein [Geminicoccaceae bacterium 1502E]